MSFPDASLSERTCSQSWGCAMFLKCSYFWRNLSLNVQNKKACNLFHFLFRRYFSRRRQTFGPSASLATRSLPKAKLLMRESGMRIWWTNSSGATDFLRQHPSQDGSTASAGVVGRRSRMIAGLSRSSRRASKTSWKTSSIVDPLKRRLSLFPTRSPKRPRRRTGIYCKNIRTNG